MSILLKWYLQPRQYAGSMIGSTDGYVRLGETEGKVLKKIQVSLANNALCAVQFWLTGDSEPSVFGHPNKSGARHRTFEFTEGERITKLELQSVTMSIGPNFLGTTVVLIRFQTSETREFEYGVSRGQTIQVNVGSGVCVGLAGYSNSSRTSMAMLGFVFLKPINSVAFLSLQYPTLSTAPITTTILEELPSTTKNDDDQPLHWALAGSRQFVTTSTWLTQPAEGLVSHLRGIALNVLLGINVPKLVSTGPAGASTTFRWETVQTIPGSTDVIHGSIGDLTVSTDEYSVWCHISDTLAPAESLTKRAAALVAEGNISQLQCSARIQVLIGEDIPLPAFSFPVQVLYSGRAHSDVQILD